MKNFLFFGKIFFPFYVGDTCRFPYSKMLPNIGTFLLLGGAALITNENVSTLDLTKKNDTWLEFHHAEGYPFEFGLRVGFNDTILAKAERLLYTGNDTLCMRASWEEIEIFGLLTLEIPQDLDDLTGDDRWLQVSGVDTIIWKVVPNCAPQNYFYRLWKLHFVCVIVCAILLTPILLVCVTIFCWKRKKETKEKNLKKISNI